MTHRKKTIVSLRILLCISLFYGCAQRNGQTSGTVQPGTMSVEPVWVFEAPEDITSTPTADNNGQVYIRTSDSIIALDILSGKVLWESSSPSNVPLNLRPHVIGNHLIVPEKESRIAVFDTDTGELRWRTPVIDPEFTHPGAIEIEAVSFDNTMVYVARFNWKLAAYRISDGQTIWEQETFGRSNPYIVSDQTTVYLGMGSTLKAFSSGEGTLLWQKELDASYIGPMIQIDNTLYIIDEAHSSLYAVDLQNQEILWRTQYPEAEEFEFTCLSEFRGGLLIAAQKLIAVSPSDGQAIWSTNDLGRLECPISLGNEIFIRNTEDTLYALDLNTGKETGRSKVVQNANMKHVPDRGPISIGGLLIVPVSDNQIVASRP